MWEIFVMVLLLFCKSEITSKKSWCVRVQPCAFLSFPTTVLSPGQSRLLLLLPSHYLYPDNSQIYASGSDLLRSFRPTYPTGCTMPCGFLTSTSKSAHPKLFSWDAPTYRLSQWMMPPSIQVPKLENWACPRHPPVLLPRVSAITLVSPAPSTVLDMW